ncbi:MAG: hypothetical protein K2J00_04525 [Bacteroidaceae bacterium]|nr:hypothetical protein [Bacteroidaceae bacterium]
MQKILLSAVFVAFVAINASAQLTVYSSGKVGVGTSAKATGPVIIKNGATEINASTVIIDAGTRIEKNAVFRARK